MKKILLIFVGCFGLFFSSSVSALDNTADISQINSTFNVRGTLTTFSNLSHFTYDNYIFSDDMYYNDLWSGGAYKLGYINYQANYIPLVDSYNLNFYFPNPCGNNSPITYDIKVRFYGNSFYDEFVQNNIQVVPGLNECSGGFSNFLGSGNSRYAEFDYTCVFSNTPYVLGSFYFTFRQAYYQSFVNSRISIQRNFSYECTIDTGAIIRTINNNFTELQYARINEGLRRVGTSPQSFLEALEDVDSLGESDFFDTARSIPINSNSNNFIWGFFETLLTANPILTTTFTSLLLLGFLKFVFAR